MEGAADRLHAGRRRRGWRDRALPNRDSHACAHGRFPPRWNPESFLTAFRPGADQVREGNLADLG